MCKVYITLGGIKLLYHVCPPVGKINHSLKLVAYLHIQVATHGIISTYIQFCV